MTGNRDLCKTRADMYFWLTEEQQDEQSEMWIGEWMKERKNRDLMVGDVLVDFSSPHGLNKSVGDRDQVHDWIP